GYVLINYPHVFPGYLKYLTKKYLKNNNVRNRLRLIASSEDSNVYELHYFNIAKNEGGRR
ncbi:unnamed protein product, partial [Ilex paraguariensis]